MGARSDATGWLRERRKAPRKHEGLHEKLNLTPELQHSFRYTLLNTSFFANVVLSSFTGQERQGFTDEQRT